MLDLLSIPLLAAFAFLLGLGGLFFDTAATAYPPDLPAAGPRSWSVPTPARAAPRPSRPASPGRLPAVPCSRSDGRFHFSPTRSATGGLLGAGIASRLGRRLGTGTALTCTAAAEGLATAGLAAAPNPYAAGLALAACGAGTGATMVLGPSLRQAIVPARLMGRVASTSRMLAMCAAPFGAFLGGWPATVYDAPRSTPPPASCSP